VPGRTDDSRKRREIWSARVDKPREETDIKKLTLEKGLLISCKRPLAGRVAKLAGPVR
jgi:hypothetical protein